MFGIFSALISGFGSLFGIKAIDLALKFSQFSITLTINSILFSFLVLYCSSVIWFLLTIFQTFLKIKNLLNSPPADSLSSVAIEILSSIGMTSALYDVLLTFSPFIVTLFSLVAIKFGIKFFNYLRSALISLFISKM